MKTTSPASSKTARPALSSRRDFLKHSAAAASLLSLPVLSANLARGATAGAGGVTDGLLLGTGAGRLPSRPHEADICVVGGGMAGMCAAISAARRGAKVALMHDRPVLGGNASSEIRQWISGAGTRVRDLQETGIMEEIALENMHGNPKRNFAIWDSILYEKIRFEPNIDLMLNCACCQVAMDGDKIKSVTGYQTTTQTWHTVRAKIHIDCSGDSILAPLSGAEFRAGREAAREFGEEFGVGEADKKTMGMSLLFQVRETGSPVKFTPPKWAYVFKTDADMKNKPHNIHAINTNFYWVELGGEQDGIGDTESIRDELLKIAFGVWDHVKNWCPQKNAETWELEWLGFLPGKRESRRYIGDYMLKQQDVENHPVFDDTIAYGGWQIDDHLPGGFAMDAVDGGRHLRKRRLSEPYNIPFRSIYSKNIGNLMFAGRNISATHVAIATTRVMGTCGILGQAAGTAAWIAVQNNLSPREAGKNKIREIQAALMEDDCFLPHFKRGISPLSRQAELTCDYGDCSNLTNGVDRRVWGMDNGYFGKTNKAVTYTFKKPVKISRVRLVFDSDLNREFTEGNPDGLMTSWVMFHPLSHNKTTFGFPGCMMKSYRVEARTGGEWKTVFETDENYQRLVRLNINVTADAVRFIPLATHMSAKKGNDYGSSVAHLYAFEVS
ncbi:MAG: FAD-dependent oxidoreductase [Opitutaceae bacterium]|nr:FAD-dependent oxidoreductase [Opitutaceae bacterium]